MALNDRLTQETLEVIALPTTRTARLTQETLEVIALPTTRTARVTQLVVEVLFRMPSLQGPSVQVI